MLQGMNEEQLNDTFNTMFAAIRQPRAADQPTPRPEPVRAPAPTREELKERFDPMSDKFDPSAAVGDLITRNYGGLITELGQKANEGVYNSLRTSLPEFDQHEQDIRTVLKDVAPEAINQQLLMNTYFSVVGAKTVGQKIRDAAKPPTTRQPSNQKVDDPNEVVLSDEEKSVARVMFRKAADPEAEYKKALKMVDEGSMSVKVPGN